VPKSEHPVVVRHPETGRKLLFVNLVKSPILSCRVRWAPGTLVFWDNRCTQHHAVWNYFPHSRYGERVTINGTRPQA
jgi:taurine dioxygenase